MARYVETNCYKRKQAVVDALEIFREPAKSSILSYLERKNKIVIGTDYCSSLEEIQKALEDLLGSSAVLVMKLIEAKVRESNLKLFGP